MKVFRRLLVHLFLIAGGAIFSIPFIWLVGTSAKAEHEVFVFPPRWIPRVPSYSLRSPFISSNAYDETATPTLLTPDTWRGLQPRMEAALWQRAREIMGPEWEQEIRSWPDQEYCEAMFGRGLWQQVQDLIPDEVWKRPDGLVDFATRALTPENVRTVWARIRRVLALGEFSVRNLRNDNVSLSANSETEWTVEPAEALRLQTRPLPGDPQGAPLKLLAYDLSSRDRIRLTRTVRLPIARDQISGISLPIQTDESWHRFLVTLETGGAVFQARRPIYLDLWTQQEVTWDFREPADRNSRTIVWDKSPGVNTEVSDPHTYRFTFELVRASRLRAGVDKYLNNFRWAVRFIPFYQLLSNSLYLVILNVTGQILACSLVAYAFSRLRWFGRDFVFGVLLATMMVPAQVTEIPRFMMMKWFGWYNTLTPLWLGSWFGAAFFIFLLRQFFLTIPKELEDAAKIDGCSHLGIWWRVMLPLVKPALATVAIFQFMGSWNDFMGPLIYLSDDRLYPLSYGLYMFRGEHNNEWGMLMAASTLMVLPVIAVFFMCQKHFIQGVTLTGLKQ